MLRFRTVGLVLSLFLLAHPSWGQQQAAGVDQRSILEQVLRQTYQLTTVGKSMLGLGSESAIRRAGVVLMARRPGLFGSLDRAQSASTAIRGENAEFYRGNRDYEVPVGERFYVYNVDVGRGVVNLGLITARMITVPKGTARLWTEVSFVFSPNTLAAADRDTVLRAINSWLAPEAQLPVSAQPPSPAAPPEPPPSAPAKLTPGMTRAEVLAALGPPQREVNFERRSWLTYPGLILVLEGDKLASLEQTGQTPAKIAVHSDPDGAEIYLDGQLVGSTPSKLDLPPGEHQISVRLSGYQDWNRSLRVLAGSEVNLNAKLEKK